jgi:hypothetical protein
LPLGPPLSQRAAGSDGVLHWPAGASNIGRTLRELRNAGFVAVILVPRKAGGRPMTFCTIVCTSDDRSGQSWEMLRAQARERYNGAMRAKRNGCDWPLPDTPEPVIRQGDELAMRCHALNEQANASQQRNAMRCHNDQTVNSDTEKITDPGGDNGGAEIILPSAFPLVASVILDEDREAFRDLSTHLGSGRVQSSRPQRRAPLPIPSLMASSAAS